MEAKACDRALQDTAILIAINEASIPPRHCSGHSKAKRPTDLHVALGLCVSRRSGKAPARSRPPGRAPQTKRNETVPNGP